MKKDWKTIPSQAARSAAVKAEMLWRETRNPPPSSKPNGGSQDGTAMKEDQKPQRRPKGGGQCQTVMKEKLLPKETRIYLRRPKAGSQTSGNIFFILLEKRELESQDQELVNLWLNSFPNSP